MLEQKYAGGASLPPGGQRVRLSALERSTLWLSALGVGALCIGLLVVLALPLAFGHLPLWAALLLVVAAALPGRLAQNRLLAVAVDLRAGTAVLQTARLDGLRRTRKAGERCYVAFSGAGEFSLDAAAYQRLQRRIGRRYRIVYGAHSRILLAIEPAG